jgi:periplasmic protein CpxP/Spy
MTSTTHRFIAAAIVAASATVSMAQTAPTPAPGGQPPMMMRDSRGQLDGAERMQQHTQRRMERLKRILQITPQQEGAWNAWAAAMRPTPKQRPNRDELARLTTPERIDRMKQMRATRMAEMDRRGDATKTFYTQLTPAQQKAFDEISMRFLRGGRGHGGHHGHHRHG